MYYKSLKSVLDERVKNNEMRDTINELLESRKEIDKIDKKLVELFEYRMEMVLKIGKYKIEF